MQGVEQEVWLELRAQHVQPRLGELPGVGGGCDSAPARLPGVGDGLGDGDDEAVQQQVGAEVAEDAVSRGGREPDVFRGPRQEALEHPHQRPTHDQEEQGTYRVEHQHTRQRPAGRADPQRAGHQGRGEQSARQPARQLADHQSVERHGGRRAQLEQHDLPGEDECHRGPEREAEQEQTAEAHDVAEPGRASGGGIVEDRGLGGNGHVVRRRPSAALRHPGVREPSTAQGTAGAGRLLPKSATNRQSPSFCFRHTVRYLV
jgi:hypothetical protein